MKKIFLILLTAATLASCSDDLEKLNENVKDPSNVPGEVLFTSAQKSLVDQIMSTNVNDNVFRLINQYWTETVYTDESNYDLVTRTIPEQHWQYLYKDVLKDLDQSAKNITNTAVGLTENPLDKQNKLAIIEVLNVYTYAILVETFGDVPYSQALNLTYKTPKYDDGLTIYKDLIVRLNKAIANLNTGGASFGGNDRIYAGDVSKWIKFANTLKLRLGITISDIPSEAGLAQATVSSAAPFVFASNDDNADFKYLTATPNTNPLYVDLFASGRSDFVPTSTLIDVMNNLNDPRRSKYFDNNIDDPATPEVEYIGGTNGASNSFNNYTHISKTLQIPDYPGTILDYAEAKFLLAEAAERSLYGTPADAAAHYNEAITASILDWGGTNAEATAYLANPNVAYATATGTWKEKIGTQSWIAYYNNSFEGYSTYRRLDYPVLVKPADAVSDIPVRYTYPIIEQSLNKTSYTAASQAIGGDKVTTKLFWDKF
ncbi:SusD/RagB family nutrient-binding outer membrane lipoprotein [Flavobacterium geliluteum]|uniref:SusD/RagB family nutrient-binding outer membrane lipoprotein n=1 Tax=Flavobacterium geliluteum TaxID=2816120 RepID=A0A940XE95_9FLAO|nr:SusD/RagB family nutrient-binding outer membrane lipoprotein [Flavobacterium geliluteum]MBP4137723.1 SusD/RagB family nutrient-binding outer membrane lipoprotein [Flavobacterium geliluteum]